MVKSGEVKGLRGVSNRPQERVSSFSCINLARKRANMLPCSVYPSPCKPLLSVASHGDSPIYGCLAIGLSPECLRVATTSNHSEVLWSVVPSAPIDMVNLVGFLEVVEECLGDNSMNGGHLPPQSGVHIYDASLTSESSDPLVGCPSIPLLYGAIGKSDNLNSVKINSYTVGNISHTTILAG